MFDDVAKIHKKKSYADKVTNLTVLFLGILEDRQR